MALIFLGFILILEVLIIRLRYLVFCILNLYFLILIISFILISCYIISRTYLRYFVCILLKIRILFK